MQRSVSCTNEERKTYAAAQSLELRYASYLILSDGEVNDEIEVDHPQEALLDPERGSAHVVIGYERGEVEPREGGWPRDVVRRSNPNDAPSKGAQQPRHGQLGGGVEQFERWMPDPRKLCSADNTAAKSPARFGFKLQACCVRGVNWARAARGDEMREPTGAGAAGAFVLCVERVVICRRVARPVRSRVLGARRRLSHPGKRFGRQPKVESAAENEEILFNGRLTSAEPLVQ
eukprot:5706538-Pleurochrysis_carterae.AAC.6